MSDGEIDESVYCIRFGYHTRLDGTPVLVKHDWGKWQYGYREGMRRRECANCSITQETPLVRKRKEKAPAPKPLTERGRLLPGRTDKIVHIEEYMIS